MKTIGNYAFESYSSLKSIKIQSSVTSIGNYAISSCSELETVTIGEKWIRLVRVHLNHFNHLKISQFRAQLQQLGILDFFMF